MPDTTQDRILAIGTLLTAVAVVVMVGTNWEAFSGSAAAEPAPTEQQATVAQPRPTAPPVRETNARRTETTPEQSAPPALPVLVIAATRGPSWLEVRVGSSTGEQLYYGTLEQDATSEFDRLPVWVRIGAAQSVDIRLGATRVDSLPIGEGGVVQFVASEEGVTAALAEG